MPAPRRPTGDDVDDFDDRDDRERAPRRMPPRGRQREARFELEFGDFEPAERPDRTRTGGSRDDRTRTGDRTRGTVSGTYDPVDPLPRSRRPRDRDLLADESGTYDVRLEDRDRRTRRRVAEVEAAPAARSSRDAVETEIEALERFEDAIESVRSPSDRGGGSDLGARVLVAIPAAIVAILLVAAGGPVFVAGIVAFGLVGVWELTRMFEKTRPSLFAGGVGVLAVIVSAALWDREGMLTALVATVPIVFLSVALSHPKGSMPGVAVTMLGIAWIGLALGHVVLLRDSEHGAGIVVDVLIGTFLGDTGAYLGGRMFGNRKLWPRISPNKTVEGLLIGVVVAVAATWFAGLYQDWLSGTDALLLGLAVAVVAPLGDLFESFLKRDAGTKDAGGLFGVHGGVLDRLDAAMFAVVAGYYVWLAMGMA
ncbi:phosphatidate cytidylyltransferase [Patulibacter sp.]|uniref:phosphatidate cytidylyltransferase n=1 Tax=Patulibacter sp. TaxID=1912859 RepID=UPI00271E56FC|nr:phosphatidate cytidylyltransferase [Patulibacter sp.]MDO9410522.1 phosphatidate cytidylyltransferase [Patulibacter sp.]